MEDLLHTLAELSVTLAGFSSIVVAITRNKSESPSGADNVLVSMILVSLIVTAFALLPSVVSQFGVSEELSIRICSGVFSMSMAGYFLYALARTKQRLATYGLSGLNRRTIRVVGWIGRWTALLYIVISLTQALSASGVFGDLVPAIYVSSLYALLLVAAVFFLMVFLAIVRQSETHISDQ